MIYFFRGLILALLIIISACSKGKCQSLGKQKSYHYPWIGCLFINIISYCFILFVSYLFGVNLFLGGFFSDVAGYVARSCKKCPNASFVHFDKAPGIQAQDCKSCPRGNVINCQQILIGNKLKRKKTVTKNKQTNKRTSAKFKMRKSLQEMSSHSFLI